MNITQTTVQCIRISRAKALGLITVFLENDAPHNCMKVTITCTGDAWTAVFGVTEQENINTFLCSTEARYLVEKLISIDGATPDGVRQQEAFLFRIVDAVQSALREIAGAEVES